jgi:DNA end-binding protein Ku
MGEEAPNEDMLDKEIFVEVSKEELDEIALESTRTIEIDEFVAKSDIDPRSERPNVTTPDFSSRQEAIAS